MSCYAQDCREPPKHELLSFPMCTPHYIEALEHSAHIVSTPVGVLIIEDKRREEERLAPARRRLEKRLLEKAARKAATGKSADFSARTAGRAEEKVPETILLSGETSSQTIAMGDPPQLRLPSGKASSPPKPLPAAS